MDSGWASSRVVVSLIDHFHDLALKSLIISTKFDLRLEISIISFSKLLIRKSNQYSEKP